MVVVGCFCYRVAGADFMVRFGLFLRGHKSWSVSLRKSMLQQASQATATCCFFRLHQVEPTLRASASTLVVVVALILAEKRQLSNEPPVVSFGILSLVVGFLLPNNDYEKQVGEGL